MLSHYQKVIKIFSKFIFLGHEIFVKPGFHLWIHHLPTLPLDGEHTLLFPSLDRLATDPKLTLGFTYPIPLSLGNLQMSEIFYIGHYELFAVYYKRMILSDKHMHLLPLWFHHKFFYNLYIGVISHSWNMTMLQNAELIIKW